MRTKLQRYNKAFGAIVGGVLALLGVWGVDLQIEPEQTAAIVTALSTLGAFLAPKNKE